MVKELWEDVKKIKEKMYEQNVTIKIKTYKPKKKQKGILELFEKHN